MKKRFILNVFLVLLLLISFSCKDDDGTGGDSTFVLNTKWELFSPGFISVSNQNDEILYEKIDSTFDETVSINISSTDKIDVTYGSAGERSFKLITCKDVESPFELVTLFVDCENEFSTTGTVGRNVYIIIDGIEQFEHVHVPFYSTSINGVTTYDNKTQIEGLLSSSKDVIITFKISENDYKSILINAEDWFEHDGNFIANVDFKDFVSPIIHEINLSIEESWKVRSEIFTSEERIVSIALWRGYKDTQDGDRVKLFLLPEIEIDKINLNLCTTHRTNGYNFNKIYHEIPQVINLFDPEIELPEINKTSYDVEVLEQYTMSKISYDYEENYRISSWDIYQRQEDELKHTLPNIPISYVEDFPILANKLEDPDGFIVEIFEVSDASDFQEKFNTTSISKQLNCLEYSSKHTGEVF